MCSMIAFHKREDPINPCLVIGELGRGQPNVKITWIEKCMSFHAVSCELIRSCRLEPMGSSIQGIEGCHHSTCDCRWCLYTGVHSSTQCNKHYQLIAVMYWLSTNCGVGWGQTKQKCNRCGGVGLGVSVSPFNNTNPKWHQTMWAVICHCNEFPNYEKMTEVAEDDSRHLAGA